MDWVLILALVIVWLALGPSGRHAARSAPQYLPATRSRPFRPDRDAPAEWV